MNAKVELRLYESELDGEKKNQYFTALLTNPDLSDEILEALHIDLVLEALYSDINNTKRRAQQEKLAEYIFCHKNNLPLATLNFMASFVTKKNKATYIEASVKNDCANNLQAILGISPTISNDALSDIFKHAINFKAVKVLNYLLDQPSLIPLVQEQANTLVHLAAAYGPADLIEKLHNLGHVLNCSINGWAPVHIAAMFGNTAVIEKLHEFGAVVNRAYNGLSAAHIAAHYGQATAIEQLHNVGVPLDCANTDGNTPVHFAAKSGQVEVIKTILEQGVRDKLNNNGKNWRELASPKMLEELYKLKVIKKPDSHGLFSGKSRTTVASDLGDKQHSPT